MKESVRLGGKKKNSSSRTKSVLCRTHHNPKYIKLMCEKMVFVLGLTFLVQVSPFIIQKLTLKMGTSPIFGQMNMHWFCLLLASTCFNQKKQKISKVSHK